jgi:hypothetical protein
MASAFAFRVFAAQPDIAQEPRVEIQERGPLPLPVMPAKKAMQQGRNARAPGGQGDCAKTHDAEKD